jgi:DNA-binding MarR family transcriptional regulator
MSEPRWLNPAEARAWRGYLRMRARLELRIGRDLQREAGLSMPDYTVLAVLSETPGHRLRLIELAERMQWSTSRVAHHLDRMRRRGMVYREEHPTNSRAAVIALTAEGLDAIVAAAPDHVASVRRHFVDLLTEEQIRMLGDVTETVLAHLGSEADDRD